MADKKGRLLDADTVALNAAEDGVVILDQRKLPGAIAFITLKTAEEFREAIYTLAVRGAPAIGVCAALGIYTVALHHVQATDFWSLVETDSETIGSSRPTAVNLRWAVNRMMETFRSCKEKRKKPFETVLMLKKLALEIRDEDIDVCRRIGENALSLLKPGMGLLTHCNAGRLATVRYGTATAPMYLGQERQYGFHIYADETRPLLQGARLTALELYDAGMEVTLLCDNMSGSLMREGKVNAVFVGCDRVAANGDTANKIGTSMVALAAKRYGIPFYVCAPLSTVDFDCKTGNQIIIEQRAKEEVTEYWYRDKMTPDGVDAYNPAFDVTDADLITAVITEKGIARAPYEESLKALRNQ